MKLEITVGDDVSFAGSLGKILDSLPQEKRDEIVMAMITQFLVEPAAGETLAHSKKLLDEIRKFSGSGYSTYGYTTRAYADMTEAELRGTSAYTDGMKKFVSVKDRIVTEVSSKAKELVEKKIGECIATDPQIQLMMTETLAFVKENFAAYVQSAVTQWFAQNMTTIATEIQRANSAAFNAEALSSRIAEKLGMPRY